MNPEDKFKRSPVEDFIALQKKVAKENNIVNHKLLTLKDDVWHMGAVTLKEYNEIHADGNKQVVDEHTGNYI